MTEILKITDDTASAASHIYAQSWKVAYKNIMAQQFLDDLSLERWTPLLRDSGYDNYVLVVDGELVATSSIAPARDEIMQGWGEIISVYVLPCHWHKGYGKELFAFATTELCGKGFDNIYLWVLEDNQHARDFYERNGFATNGDRQMCSIGGQELAELRYVYSRPCRG